ncbi:MAG TPA: SagB/ThcOx family dehydrogenase [Verrucomicrobiae bacterium]|nr:SagB/ThcOx family dehydrogenase [Verrucomicrobiae bacterium]
MGHHSRHFRLVLDLFASKPRQVKPTTASDPARQTSFADIIAYHDRTKHQPGRYARGPGGLDWASQPDPFRRFPGAPLLPLPLAGPDDTPPAAALFGAVKVAPRPFTLATLGLFFELSMGLSARKTIPGSSWFLRINPSSGNLHPTEAYAVLPTLEWLPGGAGVYHYAPLQHELEQRARRSQATGPDATGFCVGLTSIIWREAWKYGERAFRYCQHDVGHALATLRFGAAALGWRVQRVPEWDDAHLARLLGLDRTEDFTGAEREIPELLVRVTTMDVAPSPLPLPGDDTTSEWFGRANQLSQSHVEWPVIDEAIAASERKGASAIEPTVTVTLPPPAPPPCAHSAGQLIRQRRSAVDFDGVTGISREQFLAILDATLPRNSAPPFDAWPFPPRLHLVLFVHRVAGLDAGMYLWLRAPDDADTLRQAFRADFKWEAESTDTAPLFRLGRGDLRDFARTLSCGQDIAADGAFSLGMLALFEPVLRERGAAAYRELFWEAGMIGQALYLAAEAAGVRGTGIGCYLDDVLHRALGLAGHDWQSLYHFTIGGAVEDLRLRTVPPYAHLAADV